MILHRLEVAHWRSILDPVDPGPFCEGLNVVHAPNGSGKSSMFEAVRRALFDAYHVSGSDIQAVQPWARPLSPRVAVEFTQGGRRYRLEKGFLEGAACRLSRFEEGAFKPLAEGRAGDTQLREILGAPETPGRGLSKPEHWGWAQVLWAPQGGLPLSALASNVSENLRAALGVQVAGPMGGRLEQDIEERYDEVFTRSGKARGGKRGSPLQVLDVERAVLLGEVHRLNDAHQAFEVSSRLVEDSRSRRLQARREAEELQAAVRTTREQVERIRALQKEVAQRSSDEQSARQRFDALRQVLEQIAGVRRDISKTSALIGPLESRADILKGEVQTAVACADVARARRDEIRAKRPMIDAMMREVEEARSFLEDGESHRRLTVRRTKLRELETIRAEHRSRRNALVAPDARMLKEIRRWIGVRERAAAALNASLLHLTLKPVRPLNVRRRTPAEEFAISPDAPLVLSAAAEIEIELEGVGSLRVSGPEGKTAAHREDLNEAESQLGTLTQAFGTDDPDRLQGLRGQADDLDRAITQCDERIAEVLEGEDRERLEQQAAELEARLEERRRRFPAWAVEPPVVKTLHAHADEVRAALEVDLVQSEDAFEKSVATASALTSVHNKTVLELKNARLNLDAAGARLAAWNEGGQTDELREAQRQDALIAWETARRAVSIADDELRTLPPDAPGTLGHLERRLAACLETEAEVRDAENRAEGSLQALAVEGAYSKLVECQEKLADLEERIRRERIRTEAIRLLYETVTSCKAAAVAAVAEPVETVASGLLARIAGPRLGHIRLTADFVPRGVQPGDIPDVIEPGHLSGGEQEQLFFVTRLALGRVLAREERQLVVLDDVLTATDMGRLARVLALLEEATDRLQIVVLTCHPERYRGLAGANFLDLGRTAIR